MQCQQNLHALRHSSQLALACLVYLVTEKVRGRYAGGMRARVRARGVCVCVCVVVVVVVVVVWCGVVGCGKEARGVLYTFTEYFCGTFSTFVFQRCAPTIWFAV